MFHCVVCYPVLFWLLCTYAQVCVLDIEHGTHVDKVMQILVVQQDVDGDPPLVGSFHQVAQQVNISKDVHHQRYHLDSHT